MGRVCRLLLLALMLVLAASAAADDTQGACIHIQRITPFAPRGEVYVEIRAECDPDDFGGEDSILVYLEVHAGQAMILGEDVRIEADEPRLRRTYDFGGFELERGDSVLARLVRFGEILDLATIQVP